MSIITVIKCDGCGAHQEQQIGSYRSDIGFIAFGTNPDLSPRHLCRACYAIQVADLLKNVIALAKS